MNSYLRTNARQLPTVVGGISDEGFRVSTGEKGIVCYGPYVSLDPGRYVAGFYIRRVGPAQMNNVVVDVNEDGQPLLAERVITQQDLFDDIASFIYMPFTVTEQTRQTEVRVHVDQDVLIEIRDLVIFKADPLVWNGI